ncbi:lantibiotic immunity ABC transporter MutG family permease subunit [Clostridium tarantellae]|uniref:Lantibiotic immunity ABC transporter MutG family permease subunit n=1 Tax=Clostridium tarantellae TaxID=39493 RepID=A0A6I1MMQ5_9CLOT|nr:lantibiotic immunity ABC transporter MutG family permease subunit [Clostridium tarantellae]MPQ43522.1 lantibiotic immunity ABC transporter MutG family permease subunit [Clostridium tarantellae]
MRYYGKYLKIDFYKALHSKIILSHFVIPILGLVMMLSYYTLVSWSESEKILLYIQVVSMTFPLVISIVINMVYEQEEKCGRFQYFLTIPNKKYIPHVSKLFLLIILGLISTSISILGFGLIFKYMGNSSIDLWVYLKEVGIAFISNIPIYMIQYLVVFSFGKGASIALGITGSLICALMITGIGDGVWFVLPWGYSIRLSSYLFQYEISNKWSLALERNLSLAIILMLIYIIIGAISLVIFSNYWEGKREFY